MDNPEPPLGVPDWLNGLPVPALAFRDGEVIAVNAAAELLFDRPRAALMVSHGSPDCRRTGRGPGVDARPQPPDR